MTDYQHAREEGETGIFEDDWGPTDGARNAGSDNSTNPGRSRFQPNWGSFRRRWEQAGESVRNAAQSPMFDSRAGRSAIRGARSFRNASATHTGYQGAMQDLQSIETLRLELRKREKLQRLCANRADISEAIMIDVQNNMQNISEAAKNISATGISRFFVGNNSLDRDTIANLVAIGQEARNIDPLNKSPSVGSRIYKQYEERLDRMQEAVNDPKMLRKLRVQAGHEKTKAMISKHWKEHPGTSMERFREALKNANFGSETKDDLAAGMEILGGFMNGATGLFSMIGAHAKGLVRMAGVPAWSWIRYKANRIFAFSFDTESRRNTVSRMRRRVSGKSLAPDGSETGGDPSLDPNSDLRRASKSFSRAVMAAPRSLRARLPSPQGGWLTLIRSNLFGEMLYRNVFNQMSGIGFQAAERSVDAVKSPAKNSARKWLNLMENCIALDGESSRRYRDYRESNGDVLLTLQKMDSERKRGKDWTETGKELRPVLNRIEDPVQRGKLSLWLESGFVGVSGVNQIAEVLGDPVRQDMEEVMRLAALGTENASRAEGTLDRLSQTNRKLARLNHSVGAQMGMSEDDRRDEASRLAHAARLKAETQARGKDKSEEDVLRAGTRAYNKMYNTSYSSPENQRDQDKFKIRNRFSEPEMLAVTSLTSAAQWAMGRIRRKPGRDEEDMGPESRRPAEMLAGCFNSLSDTNREILARSINADVVLGEGISEPPSEENGFQLDPGNPQHIQWISGGSELIQSLAQNMGSRSGDTSLEQIHLEYADKAPKDWRVQNQENQAKGEDGKDEGEPGVADGKGAPGAEGSGQQSSSVPPKDGKPRKGSGMGD